MSDFRCIENRTGRLIVLSPTYSFQRGVRLVPGLNRVPELYLSEAEQYELPAADAVVAGRRIRLPARKPIMDTLAELQKPLWRPGSARRYRAVHGFYDGPQIVIHSDASMFEGRDEGPLAPDFLPDDERLALAIVANTSDRTALTRWKAFASDTLQAALARRLANLMTSTTALGA